MVNVSLLWYYLVPVLLSVFLYFWMRSAIKNSKAVDGNPLVIAGLALFVGVVIMTVAFYAGKGSKTSDTEIWNGEVTGKTRVHGSYVKSYDCNCRTETSGSGKNRTSRTVCDTCYENHYTVKWGCQSNIGEFNIDSEDSTSKSVYDYPDPPRFIEIRKGDPVALSHSYTNYIKAVPDSLFRPASKSILASYASSIPSYPGNIYDIYKVNRVIPVGVNVPNLNEWNAKLSNVLKTLGPAKQANAVIVITKFTDPNYFYALQDAWVNGKKNDIVIVIGAPNFPQKAEWVNVMALSNDSLLQVKLRDDILGLESLTPDAVLSTLNADVMRYFKRKRMHDFAYLDAEIDPPAWVMISASIIELLAVLGVAWKISNDIRVYNNRAW